MRRIFTNLGVSRSVILGCLCIALVMMSGMIQAAHSHPSGQPDHDCSLCIAVHSVAQGSAPMVLHVTSRPVGSLVMARSISRPRRAVHFRLSSRPPPSAHSLLA